MIIKESILKGFAKLMAIRYEKFIKVSNIDCIMPVPLHSSRKRMRGFNQSDILAKDLSKYLDIPVLHDCLCRVKKTIDQKGLRQNGEASRILTMHLWSGICLQILKIF